MKKEFNLSGSLILGIGLILFLFINAIIADPFQEVIDHAVNKTVKEKLIAFRKGGIERKVNTDKYNAEKVIAYAKTFLGTPHKMGGTTAAGIDCSGLVMVVHAKYGIMLPHSADEQARYGAIVSAMKELKRGDLVFFYDSYTTSKFITHSGIYLGEDEFIHTSNSKGVVINKVNDPYYWGVRFLFGTRFK